MPFPAAWKPLHNVGSAGGKGSDTAPLSDPKICCSIWSRQPARRATGDKTLFKIQCHYVLGFPQETAPPPTMEPAPCPNSR